ncbi:hypothetical protein [Caulobacter sp. S45]|uniref:hypothetical protein n=1 Tax=Caulobacter sp. S45 TaxID=1641861 RepID=UPI0015769D8F|nr:hypothetical protein [Caulobacter sp. S45]
MPTASGLQNNFTSGEICDDAWDRTDIQPVQKGCQLAQNFVVRVAGPLGKRRGFWNNGPVADQTVMGRIIPFRRSIDDALVLEFGEKIMRAWYADGSPLLSGAAGSAPFQVATPWTAAQVQTLRYKQVGDVIYFVSSGGLQPQTLLRNGSNTAWLFQPLTLTNGPWRTENPTTGPTLTFSGAAHQTVDANAASGAIVIAGGYGGIAITASQAVFEPGHVGSLLRIRQGDGPQGVSSWSPSAPSAGIEFLQGQFALSNSRVYFNTSPSGNSGNTPPVHLAGTVSDGALNWAFSHDGSGVVQVTGYTSPTVMTVKALTNLPIGNGQSTTYWSEGAYSDLRGWPTAWPALREERLVMGSTATDVDYVDLTTTAGFTPTSADFTPGTGTGTVIDTDAVRRRCGDDGSPIVWFATNTYLVAGSQTADFLIAGSVLDEPISPSAVLDKQQIQFGSADAAPCSVWDELIYIMQGSQALRSLAIDGGQNKQSRELTVLATHIGDRGFVELAWARQDQTLWARLQDGGLAAYVYHKEEQVEGWCSQQLAGGFAVEWMAVIPGEAKLDTIWLQVSRTKGNVVQRFLFMQSQPADKMFYDAAEIYAGAAVTQIGGLDYLENETPCAMAAGIEFTGLTVAGGATTLPKAVTAANIGLPYQAHFISLKLDMQQLGPGGTLLKRERIAGADVSLLTAKATVGTYGGGPAEVFLPRTTADIPGASARRAIKSMTFTGDTSRDPRVEIVDATGYDCRIYSVRPKVAA